MEENLELEAPAPNEDPAKAKDLKPKSNKLGQVLAKNTDALEALKISDGRRNKHRDALWEEEKHYSWWVSIIFSGLVLINANQDLDASFKLAVVILGCAVGIFVSALAYHVVRKEGGFFWIEQNNCNIAFLALGWTEPIEHLSEPYGELRLIVPYPFESDSRDAEKMANKPLRKLLLGIARPKTLRIRDWFQLIYVVSSVSFIVLGITAWLTR